MRLVSLLVSCLRMLLRSISMLFALGVITLAVMFGGGTVRLSCILVMLSGFVMFVSGHFRLVVCCSQLASNRLAHFSSTTHVRIENVD